MRVGILTFASAGVVVFVGTVAGAQPRPPAPPQGPARSSTQFTLRKDEAGGADAEAARSRARAGDCAGALPAFDAAIKNTIEPTLRRDRGLCHDKLGHPFPAIEDYRAYLTARPDAPDSDQIRQRLAALENETGDATRSRPASSDANPEIGSSANDANAHASLSIGASGKASARSSGAASTSGSASASAAARDGGPPSSEYDTLVQHEKLTDAAATSPLRYGTGFVLGPFAHLPRFFIGDGANTDLAYGVGATLRYATGPSLSLISELGFAGVGTSGRTTAMSGPLLMGGLEVRIPISRYAGDHLLLRGGLGYERYVVSGTRAVNDNLLGRFAFGYRHVFGSSIGLEGLVDGGPVLVVPETGDSRVNGVIGFSVAFVVGF